MGDATYQKNHNDIYSLVDISVVVLIPVAFANGKWMCYNKLNKIQSGGADLMSDILKKWYEKRIA